MSAAVGVELQLRTTDEFGKQLPCRVLVRPVGGECIVPEGATSLEIGSDRWFMSSGQTTLEAPVGELELRVERGHEFERFHEHFTVKDGAAVTREVKLVRWVNMRERGFLRT